MADNPKSLASLADELERLAKKDVYAGIRLTLLEAAAALRAPTIAAVTVESFKKGDDAMLRGLAFVIGAPDAKARLRAIADVIEAALATPSPTIAAPSPSNEVTPEMIEAAQLEYWRGVLPRDDDGYLLGQMRAAIEAALKARKPADDGAGQ